MTVVRVSYGGLSPLDRFLAIASATETWHDANALRRRSGRLFEKAGDRLFPTMGLVEGLASSHPKSGNQDQEQRHNGACAFRNSPRAFTHSTLLLVSPKRWHR